MVFQIKRKPVSQIKEEMMRLLSDGDYTTLSMADNLDASYATVRKALNELMAEGKVKIVGEVTGKRGRRAKIFAEVKQND